MSQIDTILNLQYLQSQENTPQQVEDVVWEALVNLRSICKEQEVQLIKKDHQISDLKNENGALKIENSSLKNEIARLKAENELLKKANEKTEDTPLPPANTKETPEEEKPPRHRTKKNHRPVDKETIANIKRSRYYAVVCDKAIERWQRLVEEGLITENLMPTSKCGVTTAARIACRFQTEVDDTIKWSFFEQRWRKANLQSNLSRTAYRDEKYYPLVNTIFGLQPDAPYISKRNIIESL